MAAHNSIRHSTFFISRMFGAVRHLGGGNSQAAKPVCSLAIFAELISQYNATRAAQGTTVNILVCLGGKKKEHFGLEGFNIANPFRPPSCPRFQRRDVPQDWDTRKAGEFTWKGNRSRDDYRERRPAAFLNLKLFKGRRIREGAGLKLAMKASLAASSLVG